MKLVADFSVTSIPHRPRSALAPDALFALGETGFWLDPSDAAAVFADMAGTVPALIGDPVARVNDKSGNGNHASQPTVASRPILRAAPSGERYLDFDGVDDFMVVPSFSPGTNIAQVFAGARKLDDMMAGTILSSGAYDRDGQLRLRYPVTTTLNGVQFSARNPLTDVTGEAHSAPATLVMSTTADGATGVIDLRRNAVTEGSVSGLSTGSFIAWDVFIGARNGASQFFNGHLYGLILRFGAPLAPATRHAIERHVASKTEGVTL